MSWARNTCDECGHIAEVHRRGWGPCTAITDGQPCRCRRMVPAAKPRKARK